MLDLGYCEDIKLMTCAIHAPVVFIVVKIMGDKPKEAFHQLFFR